MPTPYKLHKKGNYIGRIIAIDSTDMYSKPDHKYRILGAVGEVDKVSHTGNGMISCFFYPLQQAKENKGRNIFNAAPYYFIKVRVQKIKEKL
jgi:hypothetical protein